jgi:hypothetical protein
MNDYILLTHDDAPGERGDRSQQWAAYFAKLREAGVFQGGSAIGDGVCVSKAADAREITRFLSGYIRVRARDLNHARELVIGHPVFEAGGTVEIRELPRD